MARSILQVFSLAGVTLLLASCTSLQQLRPSTSARDLPESDLPATFTAESATVALPTRWWEVFESNELNALMDEAFTGNLNLAGAWTRLRQARAQADITRSEGRFQLTGSGSAGKTKNRSNASGSYETDSTNSFSAGLTLAYEVDLWGRIKASSAAATLSVLATAQDVENTALLLSAQVADVWVQLAAVRTELEVLAQQRETSEKSLDLLYTRQRKALSTALDVLQQQQLVAGLDTTVSTLKEGEAALQLQLDYLLGRPPVKTATSAALPELPPLPSTGLPADLLWQRPDIQAAWLRLRSQESSVTSARAARLPALNLTGSATLSSEKLSELIDNWALNLLAGVTAPILDGGRLKADVVRNEALADERFLDYRDSVLTACYEVEEALVREHWQTEHLDGLKAELVLAEKTVDEAQRRYLKGLVDYLTVLTAQASQQQAEREIVTARADLLANRITLCSALGGSWMSELAEPSLEMSVSRGDRRRRR